MDVPDKLITELKEAVSKFSIDQTHVCYAMAFRIIRHYLGNDWAENYVKLKDNPDPFMLNGYEENGNSRFMHMQRVVLLGNNLFSLQNCMNFSAIPERFSTRNTRPCFVEAEVAASFAEDGFDIEIIKESGIRGNDFDFIASREKDEISVEVTEKQSGDFHQNAIANTLYEKRNQVPSYRPAILFINIPFEWAENYAGSEEIVSRSVRDFFRRSKRFNTIYIQWEKTSLIGEGALTTQRIKEFTNPSPRHPLKRNPNFLPRFRPTPPITYCYGYGIGFASREIMNPMPSFYRWFQDKFGGLEVLRP